MDIGAGLRPLAVEAFNRTGAACYRQAMELPFELAVCGIDDLLLRGAASDATHVCSILDPGVDAPPALSGSEGARRIDLRFHDVIDDEVARRGPQRQDVARLLDFGALLAEGGGGRFRLLVHCHLGYSRSTAAAALLIAKASPLLGAEDILAAVLSARAEAWPNLRLVGLGDAALRRGGTLWAAAQSLLLRQAERLPHLASYMEFDGLRRAVLHDGTVRRLSVGAR